MELLPLLCLCLLTFSGITSAQQKGAAAAPSVTSLEGTKDWARLWCQVKGVSPKPEVEWQDSAGNTLPAEKTWNSERGGSYDITLITTVTKTDNYSCVVTQRELKHQIASHIHVYIHASSSGPQTHPSDQNLRKVMIGVAVGVLAEFLFL